jgi:hypothetical protein
MKLRLLFALLFLIGSSAAARGLVVAVDGTGDFRTY